MTRWIDADDLVRQAGIATMAGVKESTVSMWIQRYGPESDHPFPAPVVRNLRSFRAVAQWLYETGRDDTKPVAGEALRN